MPDFGFMFTYSKMQAVVSSKMPKHNTISSANQNIKKYQMFKLQVLEYFN